MYIPFYYITLGSVRGMEILSTYNDLCREIEIIEIRIWSLEREMIQLQRKMYQSPSDSITASYSGMPGAGFTPVELDKVVKRLGEIEEDLQECLAFLNVKKIAKAQIEGKLQEFEGLEYKVAYMRDIEGKYLDQIADELGYSYDWIRKVSSRIKAQRRHKEVAKM